MRKWKVKINLALIMRGKFYDKVPAILFVSYAAKIPLEKAKQIVGNHKSGVVYLPGEHTNDIAHHHMVVGRKFYKVDASIEEVDDHEKS